MKIKSNQLLALALAVYVILLAVALVRLIILSDGVTEQTAAAEASTEQAEAVFSDTQELVASSTTLVYEYYYEGNGYVERAEQSAPYFLLDMDEVTLEQLYSDWQLVSFSADEVVLRKTLTGDGGQYYTIGEYEGYVAVYYNDSDDGTELKQLTDRPISAYAEEEQERLREGILVYSEEELYRVLEDYGS